MKYMKNILKTALTVMAALPVIACEQEFNRPDQPVLEFDNSSWPQLSGHVTAGVPVDGAEMILRYTNGLGRTVEAEVTSSIGITSDLQTVTLEEGEGFISIPLKGTCENSGIQDIKARIHYDEFYIFCPMQIGVRPETMDPVEVAGTPSFDGHLFRDVEISGCNVSVTCLNGWSRTLTAKFSYDGEGGIESLGLDGSEKEIVLGLDGSSTSVDIPLSGTPTVLGEYELVLTLIAEGSEDPLLTWSFMIDINDPTPYEQETVTHTIIVTDRNTLMSGTEIERKEFTYNTVFVDMNGDGYVSDNFEIWLDRNIGATSTDVTSPDSYGFIYQAGRNAPGYIKNSQLDAPGNYFAGEDYSMHNARWYNGLAEGNTVIYKLDESGNKDMDSPLEVEPGKIGPSNPCPRGYRMPKIDEFRKLVEFLGTSQDAYTGGILKMPLAGAWLSNGADNSTGVGTQGYYWSAPLGNGSLSTFEFRNGEVVSPTEDKAQTRTIGSGMPIRCVKANADEIADYSYIGTYPETSNQ